MVAQSHSLSTTPSSVSSANLLREVGATCPIIQVTNEGQIVLAPGLTPGVHR